MSTQPEGEGPYFIYALLDPRTYRRTKDELRSIFYVGKGRGNRPSQHERDVRNACLLYTSPSPRDS